MENSATETIAPRVREAWSDEPASERTSELEIRSAATAMARTRLSKPVQLALADGLIPDKASFFDYGCGRGGDIRLLQSLGYSAAGWDPQHAPQQERSPASVVNLGYVLNVIEDAGERRHALRTAWSLAEDVLVVAARPDWEAPTVKGRPHRDGLITSKGTFQKFFAQEELRAFISGVCGVEPVAAAPGIFYACRDSVAAAGIRARRLRGRRSARPRAGFADRAFEQHRDLFEALAAFWDDRGRMPGPEEFPLTDLSSAVGSATRAETVLRKVLGQAVLVDATQRAADAVVVFVALEAFRGRPKFSDLPGDLQADVRAFFGSYKQACASADALLYSLADEARLDAALRSIPFGKVLPDAVYVHADHISELPPLVRVYEGAGRALVGRVENATLVKLSRRERKVSYLAYPAFDKEAHPALAVSLRADLRSFHIKWRDYRESPNPPVLHRKESFVPGDHPAAEKYRKLTAQEERAGLYENASSIGTRRGWQAALASVGKEVRGHRLVRADGLATDRNGAPHVE